MTDPNFPTGNGKPQSALSEAVEQAARAGSLWLHDLAGFAENEAQRLSSGHYGLTDLTTAQVQMMRIWIHNSIRVAGTLSDNLSLLAYSRPPAPPATRTVQVAVPVPAQVEVTFQVSDLIGALYRIPSDRVRLDPTVAAVRPLPAERLITVHVDCARAPADTYSGRIFNSNRSIDVAFQIAIDELGEPLP